MEQFGNDKKRDNLTSIEPAGGQGNKNSSVYLLICYHFESHK